MSQPTFDWHIEQSYTLRNNPSPIPFAPFGVTQFAQLKALGWTGKHTLVSLMEDQGLAFLMQGVRKINRYANTQDIKAHQRLLLLTQLIGSAVETLSQTPLTPGSSLSLLHHQDGHQRSALHHSYGILTQLLLDKHMPVDAQDDMGMTPLMLAAKFSDWQKISLLLDAQANTTLQDNHGLSALDYANAQTQAFITHWFKAQEKLKPHLTASSGLAPFGG